MVTRSPRTTRSAHQRVPAQAAHGTHTAHRAHIARIHGPQPCRRAHPEPDRVAQTFARLLLEVLTARRPADKLVALTRYPVPERLLALLHRGAFRPQRGLLPVLRNVHTSTPDDRARAIEACASIQLPDGRVEMLAFRLEHVTRPRPTWKLTALNARAFPR
jgi:hypothetical protein